MSDDVPASSSRDLDARAPRGQSLVEFVLVLPLFIVLLLGIADFGRVFHAGIVTESAARAAAEIAALEYARRPPDSVPANDAYYARLHELAAETVCGEMRILPETTHADTPDGSRCATWPAFATCVHDGGDTRCSGAPPAGFTTGPTECDAMAANWAPDTDPQGNSYVEVRVCYLFKPLVGGVLSLPFGSGIALLDTYLQRESFATVPDY